MAKRPGDFGATIFNKSFEHLGLNYIYKPFGIDEENLKAAVNGMRALGVRGCGVSMPHKIPIMEFLDEIDPIAQKIGAINTIVNNNGRLTGFNTDFEGAKRIIKEKYDISGKKVLIIGAGGVSRAIIVALKESNAGEIFITNRDEEKGREMASQFEIKFIPFGERNNFRANLLINATSVGMSPQENEMIIEESAIDNFDAVMDVVVYPNITKLTSRAKEKGKITIPGFSMSLYQAVAQFKMYTGQEAPIEVMSSSMKELFEKNK